MTGKISDMDLASTTSPLAGYPLLAGAMVPIAYNGLNYRFNLGDFARRTVYVDDYLATGDGSTNDATAIQTALTAITSGILKFTPGKTYRVNSGLIAANSDIIIDARGATITSPSVASEGVVSLTGDRIKVIGGIWKLTGASDVPWFFNVAGANCEIDGARMVKTPDAGGYHNYIRHTADGFVMRNCRMEGSNGNYWEASNSAFINNAIIGRSTGGDDGIALKGLNDNCRNFRIIGNYFENLASGLSVGSEIGVLAANDATYSRTVGQVVFTGNTLKNCYGIAYIKPGGSTPDYRDGTAEDIVISNNTLIDESGTKFERGIAITPGKGARVRNVYGRNNIIRARSAGGSGRLVGALDIFILDDAGGTAEADVSGVDLQVDYQDIWNGVANGAGGAPGYPVTSVVSVALKGAATIGTISDIILDIRGNGSAQAGLVVGIGLTAGAIRVRSLDLTNVNVTNAVGQGGAYLLSDIYLNTGYWSVTPAAGTELAGAGTIQSQITSKDSGFTATGAAEAFPSAPNLTIDVNANAGRVVTFQTGFGYRNLELEAASILFNPGAVNSGTWSSTGLNLVTGQLLQWNSVTIVNGSGVLQAAGVPAFAGGDVTSAGGSLVLTAANNAITYAKFQQVAASSLVGNATGSLANATGITLAGGLAFSGSTLTAAGALTPTSVASTGAVTSSSATAGIGYATGAGGTASQSTSKSTTVSGTNKRCVDITLNGAALAASTTVSFTFTNTALVATDNLIINHISVGTFGSYTFNGRCGAGTSTIDVRNVSLGSLSEAIVIRVTAISGATS